MIVQRLDPSSSAQGLRIAVMVSVIDLPLRSSPLVLVPVKLYWLIGVLIATIGELDLFMLATSPFSTSRSVRLERC